MQPSIPIDLVHDFGGEGPVIHVAHANGFPPGTYRPFAETLIHPPTTGSATQSRFHVIGFPARPLWPGSRPESAPDWHTLADDLVQGLQALGLSGIVGVGHSLGGVCTLLASVHRPDLFRAVALVDPVILPPRLVWVLRWMRRLGLRHKNRLVEGALRRRRTWPSRQACYEHYRVKPVFASWTEDSLWAYVTSGTRPRADGQVELAYPPEWEAHIFATAGTDIWRYVPQLRSATAPPLLVIRGEHTDTFRPETQERMERLLPQAHFRIIPDAGHLAPMEHPAETGAVIRDFLAEID